MGKRKGKVFWSLLLGISMMEHGVWISLKELDNLFMRMEINLEGIEISDKKMAMVFTNLTMVVNTRANGL